MDSKEMAGILRIIKASFPNYYKNLSKEDAICLLETWTSIFAEYDFQLVAEAVKAVLVKSIYPPTYAEVMDKIDFIQRRHKDEENMVELEAWNLVHGAIGNSYYNAEEEFDKLPRLIQRIIGTPRQLREYGQMDIDSMRVTQSNFLRSYKALKSKEEEFERLPQSTKQLIEQVNIKKLNGGQQDAYKGDKGITRIITSNDGQEESGGMQDAWQREA